MTQIGCPVCAAALTVSPAKSRKSKEPKLFLMMVCPADGRHFRGFINDRSFVSKVVEEAGLPGLNGTGTGRG